MCDSASITALAMATGAASVGAAEHRGVEHAWKLDVVEKSALAGE